jgi:hypothetical protein
MALHHRFHLPNATRPPGYIRNKFLPFKFLSYNNDKGEIIKEFAGMDSPELFAKNLQEQPDDWHYRTKPITYEINSNGYRAPEWDTVDWSEAVVMFGCSQTAGIGLAYDETITWFLGEILNRPVINLGAGGTGIDFSCYNSLLLYNNFPKPWGVVHWWTDMNRLSMFKDKYVQHEGVWSMTENSIMNMWTQDPVNPIMHSRMLINMTRALWEGKTRYWDGSWNDNTAYYIERERFSYASKARDMCHVGHSDTLRLAEQIAKELV